MATTTTQLQTDRCPRCFGRVENRPTEQVCSRCGLVVEDSPLDRGPDWRSFADDDTDPERAVPGNRNHGDRGLGSQRRSDNRRQDRINRHAKESKTDRNRRYATTQIHRMTSALELPDYVGERGKWLFRRVHEQGELVGQDMDEVAPACLYAACRLDGLGIVPSELEPVAHCSERMIHRRFTWLWQTLELEVPPPNVEARITRLARELSVGAEQARAWLRERDGARVASGQVTTAAAAALYETTDCTQRAVCDAAGCTPTGLRKRRDALLSAGGSD